MNFIRFIVGATICLLAVYGGYEFYVQNIVKDKFSDDALQELRDSGFDIGSGDTNEAVSAMMQSTLGTPSASYRMETPQPELFPRTPDTTAQDSGRIGLPPSLRNSNTAATVIVPEQQSFPYPPAIFETTSPTPPQTSFVELENPVQNTTPTLDFGDSTMISPPSFQPSFDVPVFLNPGGFPENSTSTTTTWNLPGEASSNEQNVVVPAALDSASPIVITIPQAPIQPFPPQFPAPEPGPAVEMNPTQEQPPVSWPSAYTYSVVQPQTEEIRTTEPVQEQPRVFLPPMIPGEQQSVSPCQQELPAYQPMIATAHPQVRPLPPVWDDAAAIPVNPPVFVPSITVTALPPVEDDVFLAETSVPMMTAVATTMPAPAQTAPPPPFQQAEPLSSAVMPPMAATAIPIPPHQPLQDQQPIPQNPLLQTHPAATVQPAVMPQHQNHQQPIMQANGVTPLPQSQEAGIDHNVAAKVAKIGELLAQRQVADAYEQLSRMYFYDEMTPEERQYVAKHLDQLAGGVLFSRHHHILEPSYVVKEGDTVESIATQYKITPELLRKLNAIPNGANAVLGTELKVLRGPLDAKIYPAYHEMIILMREKYACRFPISVGSSYAGQEGSFTVQEKDVNRAYQLAPGLEAIQPGDPANPLGSRWIELSKELGTIGIHGTNNPAQIGTTRQSAGCFGLREQDVAEVYDMLIIGSKVTIVR